MGSTPDAPKQTAAEAAYETEQRQALNDETIAENKRRKALTRGQLGSVTLLTGLPEYDESANKTSKNMEISNTQTFTAEGANGVRADGTQKVSNRTIERPNTLEIAAGGGTDSEGEVTRSSTKKEQKGKSQVAVTTASANTNNSVLDGSPTTQGAKTGSARKIVKKKGAK